MMTLIVAALALIVAIALHAVVCRLPLPIGAVGRFIVVGTLVALCMALVSGLTAGFTPDALGGLLCYAFGCELYIFLFTLSLGSLSANILALLSHRPLTREQLDREYSSEGMVTVRIDRLLATGAIAGDASRYSLTASGERGVRIFAGLAAFFRHARPAID